MEQPLAVNAENSRAKVQNVGGNSSVLGKEARFALTSERGFKPKKKKASKWRGLAKKTV